MLSTQNKNESEQEHGWGAFGVRFLDDIFIKLNWEINNLAKKLDSHSEIDLNISREAEFIAFNCAITACHILDWMWYYLEKNQKNNRPLPYKNRSKLIAAMIKESHNLKACRAICNTSKHAAPQKPYVKCTVLLIKDSSNHKNFKLSLNIKLDKIECDAIYLFKDVGRFLFEKTLHWDLFEYLTEEDQLF